MARQLDTENYVWADVRVYGAQYGPAPFPDPSRKPAYVNPLAPEVI